MMYGIKNDQTRLGLWSSLMRSGESITYFKDEIEKNQVTFIIQHNFFGGSLTSFSFKKNPTTAKVDLDLCSRSRNKMDKMKTFENCTHCGILFDGNRD